MRKELLINLLKFLQSKMLKERQKTISIKMIIHLIEIKTRQMHLTFLSDQIGKSDSVWAGFIYHFTHYENALSIIKEQIIRPRNKLVFQDSSGTEIIDQTREEIKKFSRFYFRPLTPTQWHNESLGRRCYDIYALCPVTIFFRF